MNKLITVLVLASLCWYTTGQLVSDDGGNYIAVLASGDVTDFGYNFIVNKGRVQMERALNISGSLWVPNIVDQDSAYAKMQELVSKGYRLIISSTADHGNASAMSAAIYPNVSFVQSGGSSKIPNLSVLSYSGADMYYTAGIFCGAMSKANKVGFVHPSAPQASLGTLNAFYVGVKTANPNAEVFSVFTGAYLNPDRAKGACNILINEEGVDMIAGQQDDFTLQIAAMNAGILAVGVNGYPLRDLYGEAVGMSVLRRWDGPLTTYASLALANLSGTIRKDISASFASGYTFLDTPSHLVPVDVWQTVLNTQSRMIANATKPYWCTPVVEEFGLVNGCIKNTSLFTAKMLSGIQSLGFYYVPLQEVPFPNGTRVAVIALAALLFLSTVAISVGIVVLRRDAVILASSPIFMGLILIGVAMVFTSSIAWVEAPSVAACEARIWLPSLGFTLCMGAMIIKNVRLWIIFDADMKRVRVRDTKLLLWTGVLLAMSIVLLGLWTGFGNPKVDTQQGTAGLGTYQTRTLCATTLEGDHILYSIIALHATQLLVGCFVTFKIRVIDIEEFNESRPFGLCIYVASLVMTIAGILIGTGGIANVQIVIIVAFSLLIGSAAVLFLVFAPKFLTVFVKGERPIPRVLRGVSSSQSPRGSKNDSGTSSTGSSLASTPRNASQPSTPRSGSSTPRKVILLTDQV